MQNAQNRVSTTSKFDPEDERIFCPNISREGITGHGLLKKYYIPHLGVNICEYCEIEEEGERRNLSYYQSRKLSKHLISELQNWRKEVLKFQTINNDVNVKSLVNSLQENSQYLDASERGLNKCRDEITSLKSLLEDKLLAYFSFLEEIMLIKDLIDECKFDATGKLNLIGIGTDSTREAKYIWMSLLFSNMKRQDLNHESFGLTEVMQECISNFVNLYITVNSDCTGFVKNLCYKLLPEIARLENKQITIDCEDLINKLPTITGVDISIVNQLKARIAELERLNSDKDSVISELKSDNSTMRLKLNNKLEEISQLKLEIEELLKLSTQKSYETSNLTIVINQINEENNRNKIRISELENIIAHERKEKDFNLYEFTIVIEKISNENREVKLSYENIFLANKELEALLLAERQSTHSYKETSDNLQVKCSELLKIRQNITIELYNEKQNSSNIFVLEKEIEKLRNSLIEKDIQNGEFNRKYYEMLNDYDYLKQSNESLKKQLEGHLTNYNLLTGINHGLAKRQTVKGEDKIVSTSFKNLSNVEVSTQATSKVDNSNKSDYESFDLMHSQPPRNGPKSLYDSQIFINNDGLIPRATITQNVVFIPNTISTQQQNQNASITNTRQTTYLANYEVEKYPKDIDFITVNPKNLLISYSSLHRIIDWINSQNTSYNIYKVNLLYKASYENFSAQKFKTNCAGVENTIVLALSNTGRIIGGYTPLSWQSGRNAEECDANNKTFIFALDEGKMFALKPGAVAIINRDNCGPVFGRNEIEIIDNCNSYEIKSNPEFGSSFETNGITAERFFGEFSYTIREYEVYQIYPASF